MRTGRNLGESSALLPRGSPRRNRNDDGQPEEAAAEEVAAEEVASVAEAEAEAPAVAAEPATAPAVAGESYLPGLPDDVSLEILARVSRSDYTTVACLNKKYKALMGSGTVYEVRRKLGIRREEWVLMACGLMPWEVFEPSRLRWKALAPIPTDDQCFKCADKESLAVGTDLLVFGREVEGLVIWKYSWVGRQWSRNQGMNSPRCLFGASSVGVHHHHHHHHRLQQEVAIVAGGSDIFGEILQSAELYNSAEGTWTALPDLNSGPRKMCAGFYMDGKFYVIGGMSSNTTYVTSGEEYDMERGTWRVIENMMYPNAISGGGGRSPPLVAVVKNELYAADLMTNQVHKYNKESNTWRVVKRLPIRANAAHGWGIAFRACGDWLMVIGGKYVNQSDAIVIHSWDPDDLDHGAERDWNVVAERTTSAGSFVYNCAIMGC